MLLVVFICYAVFLAWLVASAARKAISCPDAEQRKDAYRVLRLIWATATAGLVAILFKLHQLNLL